MLATTAAKHAHFPPEGLVLLILSFQNFAPWPIQLQIRLHPPGPEASEPLTLLLSTS